VRPTSRVLLSLCLWVAVVLSASAVAASAAQADPTGSITGTVTDAADGKILAGIDVSAYRSDGFGSWQWAGQVTTASDGGYVVSGLSAGTYRVKFVDWNHVYVSQSYDAASAFDSATDVEVTDGAATPDIDAALQAGGHITGTVRDWTHLGIADFEVMVFGTDGVSVGWTDAAGRYDVGGLATGIYHVEFNDYTDPILTQFYDNRPSLGQADDVAVTVGEVTANVDATLAQEATVTGTITDATNGNPIPYAGVSFQPLGVPVGTGVCGAGTDANGRYTCKMLAGRYLVEFNASSYQPMYYGGSTTEIGSTPFVITAGQVVDDVDMQLTLMPSTVLGVTRDLDNVVVPGIAVEVVRDDDGSVVGRATSDADGKYKIVLTDLYPDAPRWSLVELRVRFTDPEGVYATQLSEPVTVGPGSGSSQFSWLIAAKPGEVKGKTLDWDGAAVPGVTVNVVTSSGTPVASTTSDANGDYDLSGIPVALHTHYDLRFSDPSGAHRFQAFSGVFVPPGGVATVDSSLLAGTTTSVGPDGNWVWQYPLPQGSDLSGVCAGDDDHLWAVGAHGTILKSVDGGLTWHASYSGTMTELYAVAAAGPARAWAVGEGGAVFATTDGGRHWTTQDSKVGAHLYAVQFVDASHGWAVGWGGTIIATADGGQTWTPQSSGLVFPLLAETFTDASHGWVVGANGVELVTTDGGQHW
jgi:5-hydroxyisourate hydrolase-like protein (transthyretin family)